MVRDRLQQQLFKDRLYEILVDQSRFGRLGITREDIPRGRLALNKRTDKPLYAPPMNLESLGGNTTAVLVNSRDIVNTAKKIGANAYMMGQISIPTIDLMIRSKRSKYIDLKDYIPITFYKSSRVKQRE